MASSREYLDFILEQLSGAETVSYRPMMGEYVLYYRGRVIGGIYDDRFLVKDVKTAAAMMPDAEKVIPYPAQRRCCLRTTWRTETFCVRCWTRSRMNCPRRRRESKQGKADLFPETAD